MGKIVTYKSDITTHNYVFKTTKYAGETKALVQSVFAVADGFKLIYAEARKISTRPCHDVWSLVVTGEEWAVNKFIEEADRTQKHI